MIAEHILSRLKGVRRSRQGWIAQCPAHRDRSPSLSIVEGRDGRVLLKCFAGCTLEEICEALGVHVRDLFQDHMLLTHVPTVASNAQRAISKLRSQLTPRERVLDVTAIETDSHHIAAAIAWSLALAAVKQEIVQVVTSGGAQ